MKKIYLFLVVFLIVLLTTGCTVDYNLNFKEDGLEEQIFVNLIGEENTKENINKMNYSAEYEAAAISKRTNQEKYKYSFTNNQGNFTGIFSYNYGVDNFNNAHLASECYDSFNFVKTDNGYSLITSDIFKCLTYSYLPVDKHTITITSDRVVTNSNADKVENNKYIWIINSNGDSKIKKPIKIDFSDKTLKEQQLEKMSEKSGTVLIFVLIGVLSIAAITVIVFMVKNKKNHD